MCPTPENDTQIRPNQGFIFELLLVLSIGMTCIVGPILLWLQASATSIENDHSHFTPIDCPSDTLFVSAKLERNLTTPEPIENAQVSLVLIGFDRDCGYSNTGGYPLAKEKALLQVTTDAQGYFEFSETVPSGSRWSLWLRSGSDERLLDLETVPHERIKGYLGANRSDIDTEMITPTFSPPTLNLIE